MNAIHQIYCTHCTHGSSALERREGSLADRMLGYSARAGSMDVPDLRRAYRQIERYVYYYLPRDTPAEDKLRLAASTAPRRLIYLPSTGGLQLTGQVCYRPTDTEGRPGSYFAHVLFRQEKDALPRWSSLECLKLWQAPGWVEEDSREIPFRLPPLGSLAELLGGQRPAIDDNVFLSFLTAPAGGPLDDPRGVIPHRWRQMEPRQRSEWFAEAFRALLELDLARRESLLAIAEPGAAAVLFYGIARLLPNGAMRENLGFSTFEPNPDRVSTALAATWFHDPERTEMHPDARRWRGAVLNTCVPRRAEGRRPASPHAQDILRCLLEGGWSQVDQRLGSLESLGVRRAEDLNSLAEVERTALVLLDPQAALPHDHWRRSTVATEYLRKAVGRRLAAWDDPAELESLLGPLVGRPAHLLILELIGAEPACAGARRAADYLLRRLPGERIGELLKLPGIPGDRKVEALARYAAAHAALPPGCEWLWTEGVAPARPAGDAGPLLPRLLARLATAELLALYRGAGKQHAGAFLAALGEASALDHSKRADLTEIVQAMDDQALLSLLPTCGDAWFQDYPDNEPALGRRLQEILYALPDRPAQFSQRLDLVLAGRHLLPDDSAQEIAAAWSDCRQAILDLGRLAQQRSGLLRRRPKRELEQAARRLAESAARAMPRDRYDDDASGAWKQDRLRGIGQRLLGRPLLPRGVRLFDALWWKIEQYFGDSQWPPAPLRKLARKPWSLASRSLTAAGAIVAGLLLGLYLWPWVGQDEPAPATASARPEKPPVRSPPISPEPTEPAPAPPPPAKQQSPDAPPLPAPSPEDLDRPEPASEATESPPGKQKPAPVAPKPAAPTDDPFAQLDAPPMPPRPPVPEAESSEQRWQQEARDMAIRHDGVFLQRDQVPLAGGRGEIPDQVFPSPPREGQWSLKAGRLYVDGEAFSFHAKPDRELPVLRCEMPELAERWGLASAAVRLEHASGKLSLVVEVRAHRRPGDPAAEAKAERERLSSLQNILVALLRKWQKLRSSEQGDQIRDELLRLMEVRLPAVPPKPNREDPKYKDAQNDPKKRAEFDKAMQAHEQAAREKANLQARVEELAKAKNAEWSEAIKGLDKKISQARRASTDEDDRAVEEFAAKCRGISAVIHPVADHPSAGPATPRTPSPEPTLPPAEPAAPSAGAPASGLPVIAGDLTVRPDPDAKLDHSQAARLKLEVVFDTGLKAPKWLADRCRVSCMVRFRRRSGPEQKPVPDVLDAPPLEVPADTLGIDVRFDFDAQRSNPPDEPPPRIATTTWLQAPLERLAAGDQIVVRFRVPKGEMNKLQELLGLGRPR